MEENSIKSKFSYPYISLEYCCFTIENFEDDYITISINML